MLPNPFNYPIVQKVFADVMTLILIIILMLAFSYLALKFIEVLISR